MKRKGMHETGGFQAVPEQPPAGKKSRKGLIAGGIIGGILLLAAALFGIPAVKGVEFGAGFNAAARRGSENNDPFTVENGRIAAVSNNAGGILGGITTGMPLTLRVAVKPTASIAKEQQTVSLSKLEDAQLQIHGRHDPCIAHRAVPVVEAVTATVLLDLLLEGNHGTF